MKKKFIMGLLVIIFLAFTWQINNNLWFIVSKLSKKGEITPGNLKYRVNFLGIIPLGDAIIAAEEIKEFKGQKVYHLSMSANLLKLYSGLFKGHVTIDSYVDMESLSPILFKQKLEAPGKENPDKEVFYDLKNNTMTLNEVVRLIYPNTQDLLSRYLILSAWILVKQNQLNLI